MLNKKYLEKLSSEKKRLSPIKIKLSSVDAIEELARNTAMAESMIKEFSQNALKTNNLLRAETEDAVELLSKVEEIKQAVKDLMNKLIEDKNELEDAANSGYGYLESKLGQAFRKNAETLGVDPMSVKEYKDYTTANEDLFEALERFNSTSNTLEDTFDFAEEIYNKF